MSGTPQQWVASMLGCLALAKVHGAVFGPLSSSDRDVLRGQLSQALVQAAVAMVCFRETVGWHTLFAMIPSLTLKWFHGMVSLRLHKSSSQSFKLLLASLHICDMAWMHYWYVRIFTEHGLSPLTAALTVDIAVQWGELLVVSCKCYLGNTRWSRGFNTAMTAYLSAMKLLIYLAMSLLLLSKWYLPAHIARDTYSALRLTVRNMRLAVSYRRGVMYGLRYASEDELAAAAHMDCPICYETLSTADSVKTTCGHCMHLICITSWLRVSPVCPLCRTVQESHAGGQPRLPTAPDDILPAAASGTMALGGPLRAAMAVREQTRN